MEGLSKTLVWIGLGVAGLGLVLWLGRFLPEGLRPGHLPGDFQFKRDGLRFYFPLTTMILLSGVASALMWLIRWWRGG